MKLTKTEQKLVDDLAVGSEPEMVANRFSGEKVELEPTAVAVYDLVMGSESLGDHTTMNKALTIFRKNWPREYMVLLD